MIEVILTIASSIQFIYSCGKNSLYRCTNQLMAKDDTFIDENRKYILIY